MSHPESQGLRVWANGDAYRATSILHPKPQNEVYLYCTEVLFCFSSRYPNSLQSLNPKPKILNPTLPPGALLLLVAAPRRPRLGRYVRQPILPREVYREAPGPARQVQEHLALNPKPQTLNHE